MNIPRRRWLALVLLGGFAVWLCLFWLERSSREAPYSLIEPGLYLGAWVPEPPPGTRAVVNLCGREDPYAVEACLHEPIFEGPKAPDLAWLRRVVWFIGEQRRSGKTVNVHCLAGMNRSAAAVAYLMHEHDWPRDRALAFVQARRPQVQPNPALLRLLAEWERSRKEKGD
jgi:hypothetical protein